MLAALSELGNVSHACLCAGICRKTHYNWLAAYPEYREAVADAMEEAYDNLKFEAWRRAVKGTLQPVYQDGKRIGQVRVYSDRLLMLLLEMERPWKYGRSAASKTAIPDDELMRRASAILTRMPPARVERQVL